MHLASPTKKKKKKTQQITGLLWIWRQNIPHLGALLWPIYLVNLKAASFEWDPEQEKALYQVQVAGQAALPFVPYDPADPMVLEGSVADRAAVRSLWQAPLGRLIIVQALSILKQNPVILC